MKIPFANAVLLPLLALLLSSCRTPPDLPPPPPAPPAEAAPDSPSLYILRWNPAISSFTEDLFLEGIDRLARDGAARTSWSLHDWEDVRPGDWALFARVGGEDPATDGIAGICRFASLPYEALSWRGDGTTVHYAEIDLRLLNDPASTGLFAAPGLEPLFPTIDWHGGHSGVPVPPHVAAGLALVLADRLAAAEPADFPPDSFASADNGLALALLPGRLVTDLCPGLRADPPAAADAPSGPLRIALDWPTPFAPDDTHPFTFHAPAGDITAFFMNRDTAAIRKTLPLPGWTAYILPLAGDTFELLLFVPPRNATPEDIEAAIPAALATERTAPGRTVPVFLSLPKLSALATGPYFHPIRLELDEGSPNPLPSTASLSPPDTTKPVRLLLNRPFALALRDTRTSTPLLTSIVISPCPPPPRLRFDASPPGG